MRLKRHLGLCILLLILQAGLLFAWQIVGGHAPSVKADAPCGVGTGYPDPLNAGFDCGSKREQQIHFTGQVVHRPGCGATQNLVDSASYTVCPGDTINVTMYYDVARTYPGEWDAYILFNGSSSACSSKPWAGCMTNLGGTGNPAADLRDKNQDPNQDSQPSPYSPSGIVQNNHCPSFFDNTDSPFEDDSVERAGNRWFSQDVTGNHYPYAQFNDPDTGKVSCGKQGQSVIWYGVQMNSTGRKTYSVSYTINSNVGTGQNFVIQAGLTCGNISQVTEAGCPGITNRTTSFLGYSYVHGGGNLYYATKPQNINITTNVPSCSQLGTCPTGDATCTADSTSAYLGTTATVNVHFSNNALANDWYVANFGPAPGYSNAKPGGGTWNGYYPTAIANDPSTVNKDHRGVLLDGAGNVIFQQPFGQNGGSPTTGLNWWEGGITNRLPHDPGQNTTLRQFNVSGGAMGTATYYFGILNAETGALFGPPPIRCQATVTWISNITVDCNTLSLGPGSSTGLFYVYFTPSVGAAVGPIGIFAGQWNTFDPNVTANQIFPHNSYYVAAYDPANGAFLGDASFGPCMSARCGPDISPPSGLEPGEPGPVNYGVILTNFSNQPFNPGTYYVTATGIPGVRVTGGSPSTKTFAAGPGETIMNGPFTIVADYKGAVHADLYFAGGTPLNGYNGWNLNCDSPYTPETRPILKVTNGDIRAGGGFAYKNGGVTTCPIATDPNRFKGPSSAKNNFAGGIRTFAHAGSLTGSGSDFAALALGLINGDATGPYGFYSDRLGGNYQALDFANTGIPAGNLGGLLGGDAGAGTNSAAHCAPDFFDDTRKTGADAPTNLPSTDLSTVNTGQYTIGPTTITGGTIRASQSITIYVDGDLNITGDIIYAPWNFNMGNHTNTAPYLTIVAKGNVNIAPGVNRLDGLYIAQSLDDGSKGIFSTCSPGGAPANNAAVGGCVSTLTINGAVIAQQIYPLRATGTLYDTSGPVAEMFNYTPSMVVAQPNFKANDAGAVFSNSLEGLLSLPPVF
jgi:hypothetical protein